MSTPFRAVDKIPKFHAFMAAWVTGGDIAEAGSYVHKTAEEAWVTADLWNDSGNLGPDEVTVVFVLELPAPWDVYVKTSDGQSGPMHVLADKCRVLGYAGPQEKLDRALCMEVHSE